MTQFIQCDKILVDPSMNVSRRNLRPEDCEDIAASIEVHGLQTPVSVRLCPESDEYEYELYLGFRRYTAVCVNLGIPVIECKITEMSREEARIHNVVENLMRKDLTYWEQCNALALGWPEGTTETEIARALGCSQTWVHHRLGVKDLPESIRLQIESGDFSPAQVGIILQQSPKDRIRAASRLKAGKAAGETIRDMQRTLTNRKNNRSKAQVKAVMTKCLELGTPTDEAAVHAFRFATGEISDTLFFELLDKLRSV
jgi:ParB family chromosome partitioning protein